MAHSPLQAGAMRWSRNRLRVLAYHAVSDGRAFAAQLDWLCRHTTPITLDTLRGALSGDTPVPRHAVLLTFDDGDRSVLEVAAPLLRERDVPAVAFAVAGLVDTDLPFWWVEVEHLVRAGACDTDTAEGWVRHLKQVSDEERRRSIEDLRQTVSQSVRTPQLTGDELRKLEIDGIAVGNHSLTHPCLDRCTDDVLRREVMQAHDRLTRILGHQPTAFAYPNGNVDRRVRQAVADAGYAVAFAFDHRVVSSRPDPLAISRIRLDAGASIDRLRIMTSGLHPALHAARGKP